MNLFSIPEDVAYELGRTDVERDDDGGERLEDGIPMAALFNNGVTCKYCGAAGLKWVSHEFEVGSGWVLAYASGRLANKLHACESKYCP